MNEAVLHLIRQDSDEIRDALEEQVTYSFSAELCGRMADLALSSLKLGAYCMVSHTTIDKWLKGTARPNGKERFKELGLALGMSTKELDCFLFRNGYPGLYVKNPLDNAARLVAQTVQNSAERTEMYRKLIEQLALREYEPNTAFTTIMDTMAMNAEWDMAIEDGKANQWFRENRRNFVSDEKFCVPNPHMSAFLPLFLPGTSINELKTLGELPKPIASALYPLLYHNKVPVKGLRRKVIVFGFYANLTEEDLDGLLSLLKLRPFSEPETALDHALLLIARMAHGRYPHFENEMLQRVTPRMEQSEDHLLRELAPAYRQRLELSEQLTNYYDCQDKSPEDRLFEEYYTSFADHSMMDYCADILICLRETRCVADMETDEMIKLLTRNEVA